MSKICLHIQDVPTVVLTPANRERQCTGKVRHKRKVDGIRAARDMQGRGMKDPLSVYACAFCRGWHVGKSTKVILARLRIVKDA